MRCGQAAVGLGRPRWAGRPRRDRPAGGRCVDRRRRRGRTQGGASHRGPLQPRPKPGAQAYGRWLGLNSLRVLRSCRSVRSPPSPPTPRSPTAWCTRLPAPDPPPAAQGLFHILSPPPCACSCLPASNLALLGQRFVWSYIHYPAPCAGLLARCSRPWTGHFSVGLGHALVHALLLALLHALCRPLARCSRPWTGHFSVGLGLANALVHALLHALLHALRRPLARCSRPTPPRPRAPSTRPTSRSSTCSPTSTSSSSTPR
jgi:hypothetical protein